MTVDSTATLIQDLRDHRLLDPAQLDECQRTLMSQDVDVPTLAQCFVELRWLTKYQMDQVLQGAAPLLTMGPYRLLDCLGESDLGAVFQARHLDKKRDVVLKIIRGDLLADPAVLERDRKSTRLNSSHIQKSRMPSSA